MIYNSSVRDFQMGIFQFDIDEKFFSYFPQNWQSTGGAEGWLLHNRNRLYVRLYVFIDSVLERHNKGQRGFRDPIIVWGNIEEGHFNIHPGMNRIVLKMCLPEVEQIGWLVDNKCYHRDQYKHIFNNVQELERNEQNQRRILWQSHHRTGRRTPQGMPCEDQYDFSLTSDIYVADPTYNTPERKEKWEDICKRTGFSVFVNDKYMYDIGTPQSPHCKYNIKTIEGIYQLFLHYFFGYRKERWSTQYFRRKI